MTTDEYPTWEELVFIIPFLKNNLASAHLARAFGYACVGMEEAMKMELDKYVAIYQIPQK